MTSEQWARVRDVLHRALDRPPEERAGWVGAVCEDEPEIRAEVESLLGAYEADDALFETGALGPDRREGSPAASASGRRIGPYRLVEEIGVGGMSVVYRAERVGGDVRQTVALKLLQRRLHAEAAVQRFRAERQVLASLDHPHIAQFVDGGVTDAGRPYLVMEHVEGASITEYAEARDLGLEARLDLLEQVLGAVRAAHRQLVVHRDLKPSNVLVTETESGPHVTLLDFGIAKLLGDTLPVAQPDTRTGRRLLSPPYAAPEQVTGEEITTATDVYQLGVLAYELLAGARPFDLADASPTEIEKVVAETPPPRPSERAETASRRRALRGDLNTILRRALRKKPARRYGSVEALAADLERYRRGEPVKARPATLAYRARKFVGRHLWGVGAASVIVLLVAAFVGVLLRQHAVLERQRDRARAEARTSEQLSGFLVGLFEASNPYEEGVDTLTARDLLARGEERIEQFRGPPVVRARLARAMGEAYTGIGNFRTADSLLRRGLTLYRNAEATEPTRLATFHHALGVLQEEEYEWTEALRHQRRARDLLRDRRFAAGRPDSLLRADVLLALGRAYRHAGALDSAETAVRRGLEIRRAVLGADHEETWGARGVLAYVLRESGTPTEAARLYREVLAWEREHADSLEVAGTLNNLGYLHRTQGALARAERRYERALPIYEQQLGPAHPTTLVVRGNNLSFVHALQNEYAAAERVLREQLRVVRDRYPADHWRIGKWAYLLGEKLLLQDAGLAEAETLLREGVRIYEASDVANRQSALRLQAVLGHCLARRGRVREAKPLLDESHAMLVSDSVDSALNRAHAEVGLGLYHEHRGHYPRAESLLTTAHTTLDSLYSGTPGVDTMLAPVRLVERDLNRLHEEWDRREPDAD
jgi:serine/threonine-protein kinase